MEFKRLDEIIDFNPIETLKKGTLYKKISMDKLNNFNKYINEFEYAKYSGGMKFRNGDTLLARITPCLENGKTSKVSILENGEIGFGSTEYIVMRSKKDVSDEDYIFYLAISPEFRNIAIKSMTGTSGRQRVQLDVVRNTEMLVPNYQEQVKIGRILSAFDKKIKINTQTNDNLSEIIERMFINFLEKHNEELITLEDAVKKIGTGADAIQRAPIVEYDTGIRCIRVGDMTNLRNRYEWGFTEMTDKDFDNYKLDIGDIVITRTAVNGLSYMIEDEMKVVCNNGLIRMKVNEKYNPMFIFLYLKTKNFYSYVHRIDGETSVRPNMKVNYFTSYKIMKIAREEQDKICSKLLPLRNKQKQIIEENNTLTQLRDTLLPKLMNGEIDLDKIKI